MSISVKEDMDSPTASSRSVLKEKVSHVFGSSFWYDYFGGRRIDARKLLLNGLRECPTDDGAHPCWAPVQ